MRWKLKIVVGIASLGAMGRFATACAFPSGLLRMAQGARAVVKGEVIKIEPWEQGRKDLVTLRVLKVVVGECAKEVKFTAWRWGDRHGFAVGKTYYVGLGGPRERPDLYYEMKDDHGKIEVRGEKVKIASELLPAFAKGIVTAQALEDVIHWAVGPKLAAKPVRKAFRCDEPFAFDVTLTNRSRFPMALRLRSCQLGLVDLRDAVGFSLLFEPYFGEHLHEAEPGKSDPRVHTLGRGDSLTARLEVDVPLLNRYRQDPARARSIRLSYRSEFWQSEAQEHGWSGLTSTVCDIRLTCPYRRWATDLMRPSGRWAVSIGGRYSDDWAPVVAVPKQGVWLSVNLQRAEKAKTMAEVGDDEEAMRLTRAEAAALAACFRVVSQGGRLAGAKADPATVAKWLKRLTKDRHRFQVDLGRHFAFDRPGTYRVRFVLLGCEPPSVSNALEVIVPEATRRP